MDALDRYRPIIDDFSAFRAAIDRPLPTCIWLHPGRPGKARLAEDGLVASPLPWYPAGFRLPRGTARFGESLLYRAGAIHVQEAASMLPVHLLHPMPGERVLDLCAAPGNKTAQLSLRVGPGGSVAAVDPSVARLGILRTTIARLGLTNVHLVAADGREPGVPEAAFDAVLVDAPCSCEGTVRKHGEGALRTEDRAYLSRLQRQLLTSAVAHCRVGGRIVYATCTFAPEENEAVVDAVIRQFKGRLEIERVAVPGLSTAPGLTEWGEMRFDASLRNAVRLWPHAHDGGGFFAAVLRVSQAAKEATKDSQAVHAAPPGSHPGPSRTAWRPASALSRDVQRLFDWYGVGAHALQRYEFREGDLLFARGRSLHAAGDDGALPIAKLKRRIPALTTAGALFLSSWTTRRRIDLDRRDAFRYIHRETVPAPGSVDTGPVIVHWKGHALGHALAKDGEIRSAYPRTWAGLNPPTGDGACVSAA